MTDISRQRCFNHARREAAAICTTCLRCFCRECVTEHEGRVLCAVCLSDIACRTPAATGFAGRLVKPVIFLGSVLFLWFSFFFLGGVLLKLPAAFHEGSVWTSFWQGS